MKNKELKETYKFVLEIIKELGNRYVEDLENKKIYTKEFTIFNNTTVIYKKKNSILKNELTKSLKEIGVNVYISNFELSALIYRSNFDKLIEKANMEIKLIEMYNEELVNYLRSIPRKRKEFLLKKKEEIIRKIDDNTNFVVSKINFSLDKQYRYTLNHALYSSLEYTDVKDSNYNYLNMVFEKEQKSQFKEFDGLLFDVSKVREYFESKGYDVTYQGGLRIGIKTDEYENIKRLMRKK